MRFAILALLSSAFIGAHSVAIAQNIEGNWIGKMQMEKMPAPKDAKERKFLDDLKRMAATVRLELDLRPNKTFQLVFPSSELSKKRQVFDGTWMQTGATGTFLVYRVNGELVSKKDKPAQMALSKDGKSILVTFPPSTHIGKALFVRPPAAISK